MLVKHSQERFHRPAGAARGSSRENKYSKKPRQPPLPPRLDSLRVGVAVALILSAKSGSRSRNFPTYSKGVWGVRDSVDFRNGGIYTEVGNVTSKCDSVTRYCSSHVLRAITIKSDKVSYEPRAITLRSNNNFNEPWAITIKVVTFSRVLKI